MIDVLRVNDMRLLLAKAQNTLSPDLPSAVQQSNIFSAYVPANDTTSVTSSTPKMDRFFFVISVSVMTMFTGSIYFFDSQSSFYLIFGYTPTMLRLSQ